MLNKETLKEMCLLLTGGYNENMILKVELLDFSETNNELMSNFKEKYLWFVVIMDVAEVVKVLYDADKDEIVEQKNFSLSTF